jgi:hypothetical protein
MIIGIIGIVIGVIWYLHSFAFSVGSAPQQTVQYLGFVCGSIFIVGGMILLKLHAVHNKLQNIDENIEIVYKDKLFEEVPVPENEQ